MKKNVLKRAGSVILAAMLCFATLAGNGLTVRAMAVITNAHLSVGDYLEAGDVIVIESGFLPTISDNISVCFFRDAELNDLIAQKYCKASGVVQRTSVTVLDTVSRWQVAAIETDNTSEFHIALVAVDESSAVTVSGGCAHTCEWMTEGEASETTDGVMAYQCTKCGAITQYMTGGTGATSAYAVFNKNTVLKVNRAESGATLSIDTQLWTSFSKKVMEAIAARRDVTVELNYRLSGKTYQIVIPAGAVVPVDVEFAGFDGYLAGLYGKEEK